jgi:hypothetical protein
MCIYLPVFLSLCCPKSLCGVDVWEGTWGTDDRIQSGRGRERITGVQMIGCRVKKGAPKNQGPGWTGPLRLRMGGIGKGDFLCPV